MAKLAAHLLATAAPWVRIQTSLKNIKWATKAKEGPTLCGPPKNCTKTKIKLQHNKFIFETERVITGWGMLIL